MAKKLTFSQLKTQTTALRTKRAKEEEYKKLSQENYRLKHAKRIAFFGTIGRAGKKVGSKAGKYVYKKAIAPPSEAEKRVYFARMKKK